MSRLGAIFAGIGSIFEPFVRLVDNLHTSDEERMTLRNKALELQAQMLERTLTYEAELIEVKGRIIEAEAKGESWLQRNWRPLTMVVFVFIIAWNYVIAPLTGAPYVETPENLWDVIELGLGGYIIGRSAEKIAANLPIATKGDKT